MIYKWHSINLIPFMSAHSTIEDVPGIPGLFINPGRTLEIVLFGIVFTFHWKKDKTEFGWAFPAWGPCWSRRNHKFFWLK